MTVPVQRKPVQLVVGVVGPSDLVSTVEQLAARENVELTIVPIPYADEEQTVALVSQHRGEVDAWLFTGVIPYTIARSAAVLDRPAVYISYTGATLYRVLVELLNRGVDTSAISFDTLEVDQVMEVLRDADLSSDQVVVKPFRKSLAASDFVEFHRQSAAEKGTTLAITCIRSVYSQIHDEMETIRLSPALASIRSALRTVSLAAAQRIGSDAQVVMGFIDLPEPDPLLSDEVASLAASLFSLDGGRYLLVTTRGVLEEATLGFQRFPLLARLAERNLWARIGLGVGRSAAEAEALARQALTRCRTVGPFSLVIELETGSDIVIIGDRNSDGNNDEATSLTVASRRSGLSRATLERVQKATADHDRRAITAAELAEAMGIEPRTARRTLQRLERSGMAEKIGQIRSGTTGRPPILYRLRL